MDGINDIITLQIDDLLKRVNELQDKIQWLTIATFAVLLLLAIVTIGGCFYDWHEKEKKEKQKNENTTKQ